METLSFELLLDPAETVRAAREVRRRARTIRGRLVIMVLRLVTLVAWLVPFVYVLGSGVRSLLLSIYIYGYVGLSIALLVWTLIEPSVRVRRVAKMYRTRPPARGPWRFEFSDGAFTLSNELASHVFQWPSITQAVETPEFFLFYQSPHRANYLPRRIVAGQQKENALRTLLRDKLGPRADQIKTPTGEDTGRRG